MHCGCGTNALSSACTLNPVTPLIGKLIVLGCPSGPLLIFKATEYCPDLSGTLKLSSWLSIVTLVRSESMTCQIFPTTLREARTALTAAAPFTAEAPSAAISAVTLHHQSKSL